MRDVSSMDGRRRMLCAGDKRGRVDDGLSRWRQ